MKDLIGKPLGKYKILQEIGRGGMGAVYKGYDTALERYVAIKVLAPHLTWQKEFIRRFFQEAKAAAKLNHPNIVTVYDIGEQGGTYYIVMQYIEGRPLSQIIRHEGPLPLERVAHIIEQVASALEAAHRAGLIHRDVKPGNILVEPGDRAVLTDFGIAKALESTGFTRTGMMVGTPGYISPEQIRGEQVGPAADQYALGVVAYEMLAGEPPFQGDTATLLYKQANEPPPSLRDRNLQVSPEVERVVMRALAKRPEERWKSVRTFAQALTQASVGEWAPSVKPKSPMAALILAGAAALGVLILLLGLVFILGKGATKKTTPSMIAQITPIVTRMEIPAPTITLTPIPPSPPTDTPTPIVIQEAVPTPGRPRLAFASDRRGNLSIYIFSLEPVKVVKEIIPPSGYDNALWPSWCKSNLFFEANTGDKIQWIYCLNVNTGALHPWESGPDWARRIGVPKCSPKGSYLAYNATSERELRPSSWPMVIAGISGHQFTLLSNGWLNAHATWTYDERSIYYVHTKRAGERLYLYRADLTNLEGAYDVTPLFTSDGTPIDNVKYPSISPDRRQLAFACKIEGVWGLCIWDIETGDVYRLVEQVYWEQRYLKNKLLAPKGTLDWSPDGEWIAYSSDRDGDWDIYLIRPDGSEEHNLTGDWPSNEVMPVWER